MRGHPSPRFLPLGVFGISISAHFEVVIGPRENVSRAPLRLSTGLLVGPMRWFALTQRSDESDVVFRWTPIVNAICLLVGVLSCCRLFGE